MNIIQPIKNHKIIVKNTGYLTAVEVMRMLLPFVALPYVIRTIGGERYGTIVFAQTIISYFVIFINFGMDVSAVKDVSVHRNDKERLNKVVSSGLLLKLLLFLLALVVLLFGIVFIPYLRSERQLYLFAFMTCFSEILFPVWFYQGIEKMKYLTLIRLTSILFYTAAVFLFVRSASDYVNVALLQSLGAIAAGGISFYVLIRVEKVRLMLPSVSDLKNCFINSVPFFMSRVSVVANNGMAKIVSGVFFNMEMVGAFDLAQKIATSALVPMQMMNQAVFPHIAKTKSLSFIRKYLRMEVLLSFCVAILLVLLASWGVSVFAGNQYPEAVSLLRILAVWVFFGGITTYIGAPVLVSLGYPKPFNVSVLLSTLSLIILYGVCYIFNMFSIYNFAWTLVCSEFVILLYRGYYCAKYKLI